MQALLLKSFEINSVKQKGKKNNTSLKLNETASKKDKIEYICNCDLRENKHKENCIYNLV